MEDFEYSVEICDRDWECFFAECEECNLLPPSLAGLEDSGMSDIDDAGSVLAMRSQRVDLSPGSSDTDRPVDGPPHCEGSPVEHYLSKHGIGGMESVLSGSEEDIHLQSVNIFFERLKSLTEPEPSQNFGKNSEAIEKEEQCSDGQQASRSTLPKNIQMLNSLPARGETAVGKESVRPVDTIRKTNTMRKVHSEPSISFQHEASNSVFNTNQSTETELFIREEACTETRVSKVPQWNHDSPGTAVCSVMMPHTYNVETCTRLGDFKQEELLKHLCKKCATDLASDLDMATNVKWREDQTPIVSQSDAAGTSKAASQDSPSASMKRKRRKKRRLSVEQGEGGHGYEKQASIKQSESEEEQCATKTGTGLCFSEDISSFYLNEPHSTTTSSFPVNISTAPPCDSQYQCLSESIVRQRMSKATSENDAANNRSVITPSQTDDSVMSAPNSGATVATNAEVCSKLQEEESAGLNKCPELPVLVTGGVTGKSDMGRENQREDIKCEGLQQTNHSVILPENEQNLPFAAEVKSVTHGLLSGSDSNATSVDVGQNNRRSAAKSVLAVQAGNSGGDEHTLCHSEAEPQQQLEVEFHNTDQYSTTMEDTQHPFSATSHAKGLPAKSLHFRTPACPFSNKFPSKVISTHCTSDCFNRSPDESYLSKTSFGFGVNNIAQQTERPLEAQTLPKIDILEKSTEAGRIQLAASQITSNGQAETRSPLSEDLPTSLSDITNVSSCCTLNTDSIMSLSNGNITDMSASFCSSVSEQESGGQGGKRGDGTSGVNSQPESVCDLLAKPEDAIMVSKAEGVLNPVFAMSSFWSEMEKLTINDILGLRMISKAAPPSSLPPLQESEEMADSGFFTQMEESTPEQTTEDSFSVPDAAESSLCPNTAADFSPSRSVLWESEPAPVSQSADIYLENVMLTSVTDASRPFLSERAEKCLRKISKNISVHNLRALDSESFSYMQKCEPLQTVSEGESQKVKYLTQGYEPKQDKDTDTLSSSLTDSYSISLSDIFQYFFGGKQTVPSQSATDNLSTFSNDGNSVPETYDHFFSEFDTESFFCPLITTEDEAKDKPVLIFSCSRSANRNLQFPEAYDYFFASSSSDDSSVESDEEDNSSPVRVVTRSSHKPSSSHISKDIYEDFYTDSDLRQNFFWKTAFSFRGINFSAQNQVSNSLSLVPVRQRGSFHPRTVSPLNALGNEDVMCPDPLLYHFEDRVFRQLAQQPFRYEDLQVAVSNPRLDAPFLQLKQSDMCLVCIAFASWVLKTVNPQAGDAWKAVLLANVSALSAIRYLRKYVKVEAANSETKLRQRALPAPSSLSL